MHNRGRHWLIVSLVAVFTATLFVLDLHTPLGIANHILYLGPVLLSFLSPNRTFSLVVAALCTALVFLGAALSPDPYRIPTPISLSNRLIGVFAIWVPVFYFYQRRKHEETLQRLNNELEQRVHPRTKELASVNDSLVAEVSERMRTERMLDASRRELQSLAAQLLRVQEQERRRISRDLHDDINQRLAVLIVEMDRLVQQEPRSPGSIGMAVRTVQDRLIEVSEDVRKLAYQFHPTILDDLGLSIALQRLADDFEARTNILCRVADQGSPATLPQDAATCLYRIAQESLSNVARHAKASRVELALRQTDQNQTLTITDNGVGFDPAYVNPGHGSMGLISMKERVALAEGTLEITSAPGKGTRITVMVPVISEGR
jgi:signal transduction histidine kinase